MCLNNFLFQVMQKLLYSNEMTCEKALKDIEENYPSFNKYLIDNWK